MSGDTKPLTRLLDEWERTRGETVAPGDLVSMLEAPEISAAELGAFLTDECIPEELRRAVARWAVEQSPHLVPGLAAGLHASSEPVRLMILHGIVEARLVDLVPAVADVLEHDQAIGVRSFAGYVLGRLGGDVARQALHRTLDHPAGEPEIRGVAAEQLGVIGDQRDVARLIHSLQDSAYQVRFFSAYSLGRLGAQEALGPLQRLAAEPDVEYPPFGTMRREAEEAIRAIRMRAAEEEGR